MTSSEDEYFTTVIFPQLESVIAELEVKLNSHDPAINRLLELNARYNKVVDLGCGNGTRTLELILKLHANEVIGIDIDQQSIEQAMTFINQKIVPIQQEMLKVKQILQNGQVTSRLSNNIRMSVEEYVKKYGDLPVPVFRKGDITKGKSSTRLCADYYDLAYCRYVLYHIYCYEEDLSHPNTKLAIQEMARVVKPIGLIVAYEPNICSVNDPTRVDLTPYFEEQNGLHYVDRLDLQNQIVCIYRKG